ncbi:MAG: asparagine synthetase B [Deltaproteobacteria bacterium]|nr:MAG: asparagine synthetase B [Deltaproteobacteria bacterium]
MSEIFTSWTPAGSGTPFEDIYQIPPGHFAAFSKEGFSIKPYWRLSFDQVETKEQDISDWVDEFSALILDATRIRLRADVPVGAYLSGGIDSTYISSLVKRNFNNRLSTFSVMFTDKKYDEASFQKTAIDSLNTEHHGIQCSEADIGSAFPKIIWHTEMPIFRTAPAPLFQLSKLVRDTNFKVVLTGEGADEMFAGYNIFKEDRVRRFWAKQPDSTIRPALLAKLYPYIFDQKNGRSKIFTQKFFKNKLEETDSPVYSHLLRWQNTSQIQNFIADGFRDQMANLKDFVEGYRSSLPENFMSWHPLARAQYTEITLFLSNYLLSSQGDRMAMANSVEGRYPYLDHRVMEFATRVPPKFKMNGLTEKYILKKSAKGTIPQELIDRPKQPYRAPISRCFFGDEPLDYVDEMLSEEKLGDYGYFNQDKVIRLKAKCQKQDGQLMSERENMAIVGILSTQLLHHHFIENFPAYQIEEPKELKVYK